MRRRWCALGLVATVFLAACGGSSRGDGESPATVVAVPILVRGMPLVGSPLGVVRLGGEFLGVVVAADGGVWTLRSPDGTRWSAVPADGVPTPIVEVFTENLNVAARNVLFSDGVDAYLRVLRTQPLFTVGVSNLFRWDGTTEKWRAITLPAPAATHALATSATRLGDLRVIAGALVNDASSRDAVANIADAAVWTSRDGAAWTRVTSPSFVGDGNQAIFSVATVGSTLVAGGGDSALLRTTLCCYYASGAAFWRGSADGRTWERSRVVGVTYDAAANENASVVGFVASQRVVDADLVGFPTFGATSSDAGRSWHVVRHDVMVSTSVPRLGTTSRDGDQWIGTGEDVDCADCTIGHLLESADRGVHWRDVTPVFPCPPRGRANQDFVGPPYRVGASLVVFAGCGPFLGECDTTLVAVRDDAAPRWRVLDVGRFGRPVHPAGTAGRVVTLVGGDRGEGDALPIHVLVAQP